MDIYEKIIKDKINVVAGKDIYFKVNEILEISDNISSEIVMILLSYACNPTHITPITISRNCLKQFPVDWITNKIMKLIFKSVNIYDDWDYRRFLELSEMISTELLEWAISISNHSDNSDIIEAATDFTERLSK